MGGVLQYKWEVYCRVSLSSKLRSQERTAIQMGGVLPYKLEVYCRTFSTSCRGWGFRNIAQIRGYGLSGLCAGQSRHDPENECERCAGASKMSGGCAKFVRGWTCTSLAEHGGGLPENLEVAKRTIHSEDRGLKVRFSLATIVFETFELILCQMLSSQGKKRTFKPLSSLFSAFSNLKECLGRRLDIFYFFLFRGGGGRRRRRRWLGGEVSLLKIEGGGSRRGGEGGGRAPGECLWGEGGG